MFKRHLVKTLAIGGLFSFLLVVASAWSGNAGVALAHGADGRWPLWIQGRPLSLEPGGSPGYYFWHDDEGLNLWTTTPFATEHTFTAVLTSNGHFRDVRHVRFDGQDDTQIVDGGHRLLARLHTYDGIDGVIFRIEGGDHVTLRLFLEGREIDPAFIYVGRFSVHPNGNPFTVYR